MLMKLVCQLFPHPTLEVTDGWYCLRSRVDEILARTVRRGVICVGRKFAISGGSVQTSVCLGLSIH